MKSTPQQRKITPLKPILWQGEFPSAEYACLTPRRLMHRSPCIHKKRPSSPQGSALVKTVDSPASSALAPPLRAPGLGGASLGLLPPRLVPCGLPRGALPLRPAHERVLVDRAPALFPVTQPDTVWVALVPQRDHSSCQPLPAIRLHRITHR